VSIPHLQISGNGGGASERVLVVRAGALGDTLMATPVIRRLRNAAPGREIDLLCSVGGASLLRNNGYISQIHTMRLRNLPHFVSLEKRRLIKKIRDRNYSFAVLLESAPRYRELLERASLREIRGFTEASFDPSQHSIVNNLRAAGFPESGPSDLEMDLSASDSAARWAANALARLPKPWIGVHAGYGPGSKKKDQTERLKGWTCDNFIQVARELIDGGASIVLTGSSGDLGICQIIASALPSDRVLVCAGQTSVDQLAGVIQALELFISVDSGPAHMAAALGTPLVVLWGPAILAQVRPLSAITPIRILNAHVPCAPCYGTPLMKSCTRNICMEQILPPAVISAALDLLGR